MSENSEIKHHVSIEERIRCEKTANDLIELLLRVNLLEAMLENINNGLFSQITTNPFIITFENLLGLELISGVWNEPYARLECGR